MLVTSTTVSTKQLRKYAANLKLLQYLLPNYSLKLLQAIFQTSYEGLNLKDMHISILFLKIISRYRNSLISIGTAQVQELFAKINLFLGERTLYNKNVKMCLLTGG